MHQSPKLEKPASSQDGGPALRGLVVRPTVMSPLERSGRRSPYHQSGNPCRSFAWCGFVDCFILENGNCDAAVSARWCARDSTEDAEPMCALSRRQSWLPEEGNPARMGASPTFVGLMLGGVFDPLSRGKSSSREKPSRGSPGLESLVLGDIP